MAGRFILAGSALIAILAAGAFAHEVFNRTSVPGYGGYKGCMASHASDEFLFGVGEVENSGAQDIELVAIEPLRVRGLEVIDVTVPATKGIGILDVTESVMTEYELGPVAGTVIAPGDSVEIVAQLKTLERLSYATDFEITYTNAYGVRLTSVITNIVGFSPVNSDLTCGP